jgi:hypothetical protein
MKQRFEMSKYSVPNPTFGQREERKEIEQETPLGS